MKTSVSRVVLGGIFILAFNFSAWAQTFVFSVPSTNGWTFYGGKPFMVGYDFTPTSDIQVTSLGILDWNSAGLSAQAEVGIWDSHGVLLVSGLPGPSISKPAGAPGAVFYVTNCYPPVTLTAGHTYRIGNQMFGNNRPLVGWGGAFTAAPNIAFGTGWGNNGSTFGEPVQFTNATAYFGPVFEYQLVLAIQSQPQSLTLGAGSNASFSVGVVGPSPLAYQWYLNGAALSDGGRVSGSGSNVFSVTGVQGGDAGTYQVLVSGGGNSVWSSNATLAVLLPPQISGQPVSQAVLAGSNEVFTVTAGGTNLNYQWYFNSNSLLDGGRISGSATASLVISNAQMGDAGGYQVVVANSYEAATSSVANLAVYLPVQITSQPAPSQTLLAGSNASFTVGASGTGLNYQWYWKGMALADNGHYVGSTNATLSVSNVQVGDAGNFSVVVTNLLTSATSSNSVLTVYNPVQITAQPVSLGVWPGNSASFSVQASGTALGYQWLFNGLPLSDGGQFSGGATPVLTIANIQVTNYGGYSVIVSNSLSMTNSLVALLATPATRYVNVNCANPAAPYTDWSTAAVSIQDAIDVSTNGDLILVTNGVYQTGGRVVYGAMTNRVAVNKSVAVQSVNGPAVTIIQGYQPTNGVFSDVDIRCVYMTNNTALIGFTLTNGAARGAGDANREQSGGGIWCEGVAGVIISNCIISGNAALFQGGGIYNGALINCVLSYNRSHSSFCQGGGAFKSSLINCTITANGIDGPMSSSGAFGGALYGGFASNCVIAFNFCKAGYQAYGGAAYNANVVNCMVLSNTCEGPQADGGGVYGGTVMNSAIVGNNCDKDWPGGTGYGGGTYSSTLYHCTVVANFALSLGGGTYGGAQYNDICYFNSCMGPDFDNKYAGYTYHTCTVPVDDLFDVACIDNDPQFAGPFHLSANSPCRGAGTMAYTTGTDIDGEPWANPPSMGCDEVYPGAVFGSNVVNITTTFTNIAPGYTNAFMANISGPVSASIWDFGDGTLVTNEAYISHSWNAVGDYTVQLTAYNDSYPTGQTASLTIHVVVPSVYYVNLNSQYPMSPYFDWSIAATNIQDAIDAAAPGSLVLVTNAVNLVYVGGGRNVTNFVGVYQFGGRTVYGVQNRVAIYKPLTVQSVNGPQVTWIQGNPTVNGTRCAYMTNGAVLSGFTLTNGVVSVNGGGGGGVWSESTNDLITNCVITHCTAYQYGGGAYSGTLYNSVISSNGSYFNIESFYGGGVAWSTLNGCHVYGNLSALEGGGTYYCLLNCCSVSNNNSYAGGGICAGVATACYLAGNTAMQGGGAYGGALTNCKLSSNSVYYAGGGAYGDQFLSVALDNCLITGNTAQHSGGGGTANAALNNCTITNNSALNPINPYNNIVPGGGVAGGVANNCTISGNFAGYGAGAYYGTLTNCVVSENIAFNGQGGGTYLANLYGCTLANNVATNGGGGGASQCTMSYCTLVGNASVANAQGGGGANGSLLFNCVVISNATSGILGFWQPHGGGTMNSTQYNCVLACNYSQFGGGGSAYSTLVNCTVVSNTAPSGAGGGIYNSTLRNSIVYYNAGGNYYNSNGYSVWYSCTAPFTNGPGNITNAPLFADLPSGDFHLQASSPCINSGDNSFVVTATDMDGNPRIAGGTVDMGAYEYPTPSSILSYAWAQQYGLPTDGSADYLDFDGTGMPNWQKSVAGLNPTNGAVLAMLPGVTNSATGVKVSWQSVNTRLYFLQRGTNLSVLPPFSLVQSNIVGQAGVTSYLDTSATNGGAYFYRVGVQ